MGVETGVRSGGPGRGWTWAAGGACLAALATAALRAAAGAGPSYTAGFAPAWIAAVAAGIGAAVAVLGDRVRGGRVVAAVWSAVGWSTVALLVWATSGVLFDAFRVAAVLGVPGMPPVVDWSGALARTAAGLAAVLLAAVMVRRRRERLAGLAGCPECGRSVPVPGRRRWLGHLAAALAVPYPALKLYWAAGGQMAASSMGRPEGFPVGEVVCFGAAALLALALVHRWGRVLPRWLLTAGGCVAAGALVSMGVLAGFGTAAQVLGVVSGPARWSHNGWLVALVYGSWLALGVSLAVLTAGYRRRTGPTGCARCAP